MKGAMGAVGALLLASGLWAFWTIPIEPMHQFSGALQVFFAFDLLLWIAFGFALLAQSIVGE